MTTTNWQAKQLEVTKSLVQQGSQALRQGDFNTAGAALSEANAILDMTDDSLETMQLRAQVLNETGFILQRSNQTERALDNHRRAAELCEKILDDGVDFRGNAAATNINYAGLLAGTGDFDGARKAIERAMELAEALIEDGTDAGQGRQLAFGAHSNFAIIAAKASDWDAADRSLSRAVELIEGLGQSGQVRGLRAQAAQACQQLSVLYFNATKYDEALNWGREAEKLSEEAYNDVGEQALPIYVTSQINLISYYEKQGEFAHAEDCLFKALEVVGNHPQILLRGHTFYEECRKQADNRLEAGGLPRDEVEDSYEEITSRIEEIGGLEKVIQTVREAEARARGED